MHPRKHSSSGSPFEDEIGFSRAVRHGPHVWISGTAPIADDGTLAGKGDGGAQARRCLQIILRALADLGGEARHVVRTRVYLRDASIWQEIGRAHGEVFGDVKPASTMVQAGALLNPDWLVEIEAEAYIAD